MLFAQVCLAPIICPPSTPSLWEIANPPGLRLPKGADSWDCIGTFELKGNKGKPVAVRLYALDTDSIAEKQLRARVKELAAKEE